MCRRRLSDKALAAAEHVRVILHVERPSRRRSHRRLPRVACPGIARSSTPHKKVLGKPDHCFRLDMRRHAARSSVIGLVIAQRPRRLLPGSGRRPPIRGQTSTRAAGLRAGRRRLRARPARRRSSRLRGGNERRAARLPSRTRRLGHRACRRFGHALDDLDLRQRPRDAPSRRLARRGDLASRS